MDQQPTEQAEKTNDFHETDSINIDQEICDDDVLEIEVQMDMDMDFFGEVEEDDNASR